MTVRREFLFVGGHPIVDFLNTEIISDGERVDLLTDGASVSRFLAQSGLAAKSSEIAPAALKDVKRLRAHLRGIAEAMADGKRPAPSDAAVIDRELRRGAGSLTLKQEGSEFSFDFEPAKAAARDPRFILARAAAEFLALADPKRVRRCEGARCILLYYDVTKSGTRRWCSMASCGNRQKAALHYQRVRDR